MNTQPTVREMLNQLIDEGHNIPSDYENMIAEMKIERKEPGSPWYVRLFAGLSAWIAAILFVVFLFTTNILDVEEKGFILGLIFCAAAVALNLRTHNDFLAQFGLAISLTGQILFLYGVYSLLHYEIIPSALALIALEIALLLIYRSSIHRFISAFVIPGAILAIFFDLDKLEAIHLFIFTLSTIVVILYLLENRLLIAGFEGPTRAVIYGFTLFLLGSLFLPLNDDIIQGWWTTATLLLVVLLFLVWKIASDVLAKSHSRAVIWLTLASCVLLYIPAIRMPGILGALIILLLGFWRNNRILIGLAALFLVFYLGAYYYSLPWTLLIKSLVLMGNGAVLFLARYFLLKYTHLPSEINHENP